jgi:hypothetical protein
VWVEDESLRARGIPAASLVPGAVVVDGQTIALALSEAHWVMVY